MLPDRCFGMFWSGLIVNAVDDNKSTLPTLFEWTGTCRNVNLPKRLRQIFSLST